MAFWRVRGQSIALLHGRRTSSGVKQTVLHTFTDFTDLSKALKDENWGRFTQGVEQNHPRVAPRWAQLRAQAEELLQQAQPAAPEADDLSKLRKALKYVATQLYPSPLRPVDDTKTLALAPELLDCLEAGLLRILDRDHPLLPLLVPNQERTDALVDQAKLAFYDNPRQGRRRFQAAHEYNPYDPDVLVSWGCCDFEEGQYAKAHELFQKARDMATLQLPERDKVYSWGNIRIRPYFRATANLALVLEKQGQFQAALELFQHCLERCPEDGVGARHHLGPLYERLGDLEQALRVTRQNCGGSFLEMPDSHYDGARLLVKLGRAEEALPWALRGLSINPWIPQCLSQRGERVAFHHAAVDSLEWALGYAQDHKDLWSGEPRRWLQKICKNSQLAPMLEDYREFLQQPKAYRQQRELSQAILNLESQLCSSTTKR